MPVVNLASDGDGSGLTGLTKAQVGLGNVDNTADSSKPISTAVQTALNAKGTSNFSGAYTDLTGKPTLGTAAATAITDYATAAQGLLAATSLQVGGNIGAATGTSLAVTGALTSSGTAGIGYATGSGGAVTQLTSKSTTTPAINKICGTITMNAAALAAATIVSFTVLNNLIGANDLVLVNHDSVGTLGAYTVQANTNSAGTSFKISVRNNTAGSLSEAIVLRFAIIKASVS